MTKYSQDKYKYGYTQSRHSYSCTIFASVSMHYRYEEIFLDKSTTRPALIRRCLLDPINQFVSQHLHTLICRLDFCLLPIYELPLLFFNGHQTFLELITTQNNSKRDFVLFPSHELRSELRLLLR